MHPEAWQWLEAQVRPLLAGAAQVVDLGGFDVNGSPRALFSPATVYRVVDTRAGPGVDIVADAGTWLPAPELRGAFDVALCTEVFEHVQHWQAIVYNLWLLLRPGGVCLVTCATAPRRPHSIDGVEPPPPGEWYGNVAPEALRATMQMLLRDVVLQGHPRGDVYAVGRR
jgi:SAM-dependent methyltransferase